MSSAKDKGDPRTLIIGCWWVTLSFPTTLTSILLGPVQRIPEHSILTILSNCLQMSPSMIKITLVCTTSGFLGSLHSFVPPLETATNKKIMKKSKIFSLCVIEPPIFLQWKEAGMIGEKNYFTISLSPCHWCSQRFLKATHVWETLMFVFKMSFFIYSHNFYHWKLILKAFSFLKFVETKTSIIEIIERNQTTCDWSK